MLAPEIAEAVDDRSRSSRAPRRAPAAPPACRRSARARRPSRRTRRRTSTSARPTRSARRRLRGRRRDRGCCRGRSAPRRPEAARAERGAVSRSGPRRRRARTTTSSASVITKMRTALCVFAAETTTNAPVVTIMPSEAPDQDAAAVVRVGERAAVDRQRHERDELRDREDADREARAGDVEHLHRHEHRQHAPRDVRDRLTEPEPAERGRFAQRRDVDGDPREEPGRGARLGFRQDSCSVSV